MSYPQASWIFCQACGKRHEKPAHTRAEIHGGETPARFRPQPAGFNTPVTKACRRCSRDFDSANGRHYCLTCQTYSTGHGKVCWYCLITKACRPTGIKAGPEDCCSKCRAEKDTGRLPVLAMEKPE